MTRRWLERMPQAADRRPGCSLPLPTGHFAPAKVSWISPISARLLLVNRRGIRVLVASVEELAVMAKLDRVIVRDGETAFEDAMHQVVGRLQSVAARA